jgi:hypothetical protein
MWSIYFAPKQIFVTRRRQKMVRWFFSNVFAFDVLRALDI